jgi:predicted signal transduction protein with EAL and GGDEF domain
MAFWFAPVLAAWNRIGATQSLFYSFFAVWRNWRAFLVYGGALFLAGALFTMAVTVLAILMQGNIQVLRSAALILTLLTLPTLFASFYASYRDVFPENAVPSEPPSKEGP